MKKLRALLVAGSVIAGAGIAAPAAMGAHFTSPSGAIDCRLDAAGGGTATCYVQKARWHAYKPKPRSCPLAWFPTEISLTGRTTHVGGCRGDIGPMCLPGSPCTVLRYGRSITLKGIRCTSTTTGMTCRRTTGAKRQGFKVAREGVTLYR